MPGGDLPTGTVTFLFSDVEGSTRLLHDLGPERYAGALAEHRRIIRDAAQRNGGVEVDTQGDAFLIAFPTASGAVAAARLMTAALAPGPIRVRVGLHTGTPLVSDGGYVGPDVHRGARIAAAGHGGQILLSKDTRELVEVEVVDLGDHRFKDLSAPERIYQLGTQTFPRIRSRYRVTLPVPATPFVGRERELAQVVELLGRADTRMVTLTGPGGTGKTRLALQAAAAVADRFPDGVFWVALAPLRDASFLLPTVAQVLEIRERPDSPIARVIEEALGGKRHLLVFDNLEHLLPGAIDELAALTAIDGPVLLFTSRERIQVQGERLYPVPTMDPPDGLALFEARVRALDAGFVADASAAALCARLDHLPLAIELAAARTVLFTPAQLLERISQRLDLLTGGRDLDPRQRTLRATIEWSYDLLGAREKALLTALSVFKGGWTLEAAERVCAADPDTLQSLIDKSLVRRRDTDLGPRYSMLATIAQFAAETIAPEDRRRRRAAHLGWCADEAWAREDSTRRRDAGSIAWQRAEQANVFEALAWAIETGAAEPAQRILASVWFYWLAYGLAAEGDTWAARVVAIPSDDTAWLADALSTAGEFPRKMGDPARSATLKERAMVIYDAMSDLSPRDEDIWIATMSDLADVVSRIGEMDAAARYAHRGLELRRASGDPVRIAHALASVGLVAFRRGELGDAARILRESVELFETGGDWFEAGGSLANLGNVLRAQGHLGEARTVLDEALRRGLDSGDREMSTFSRTSLGLVAADEGRAEVAVALLAEALTETRAIGLTVDHDLAPDVDPALDRCRAILGDEAFERAYAAGVASAPGRDPASD